MNKIIVLATIAILTTGIVFVFATGLLQQVSAKASENANPVAHGANTNQGYMENCKESNTAKECATGPGNNGEFTSGLAHNVNKP